MTTTGPQSPQVTTLTVLGTGVLGSQIAYHSAYRGFDVTVWDIDDAALDHAQQQLAGLAGVYAHDVDPADPDAAEQARHRIRATTDLAAAVAEADLVIEAVPEDITIKRDVWQRVGAAAPAKTIFATNTSSLLPSMFMDATGRPDRFLALHYANGIWQRNTAEIMGTPKTSPDVYQAVVAFAEQQGMVPIPIRTEHAGYVVNTILFATLHAAIALYMNGVADMETIDTAYRASMLTPLGPFQILDTIGMTTIYNVYSNGDDLEQRFAQLVKDNYLDTGKLGTSTGEGFYPYQPTPPARSTQARCG